jgi:hypothetical protein
LKGDVLFNNLTLTSSNGRPVGVDAVPSSRLDIISTDMNFVRASGGTVYLEGQSHIVTASGSAVDASGGSITFAIPGTASSIISSSGSPIFAISGGRILAQTSIYIDASAGETLYVAGTNKSVDKATGSTIFLNGVEPATLVSPYYRPTPVKCANGATSCAIQCSAGTIIAWGECASDNNSALAGFYADTAGQTYTCKWTSDPIPVTNPTAAVVCTNPQH